MSEHTPLTEAERDQLTEWEKALREWLRGQSNGAEWWFVIKAGFQRSYNLGLQDAARTSTATADTGLRERVAEIVARIEDDPRYDDSFGAAGLLNLRDDLRAALATPASTEDRADNEGTR